MAIFERSGLGFPIRCYSGFSISRKPTGLPLPASLQFPEPQHTFSEPISGAIHDNTICRIPIKPRPMWLFAKIPNRRNSEIEVPNRN